MKIFLQTILRILARLTLWRYQPRVVAISGSVGKTSTKEAIALVMGSRFRVRQTAGNYNNEIGVPLTILGLDSGGRNPLRWAGIILIGLLRLIHVHYPEVLILELGMDRPGDIAYLVRLLGRIDMAVLTDIGISHIEFFAHPADLAKEKLSLIKKLPPQSAAVLNFDSPKVFEGRTQTKADVSGYGFGSSAQVMASDLHITKNSQAWGANFKVHYRGTVVPFFLRDALGKPAVYASLAAAAVGLRFGINLVAASEALANYVPPPGRLRLLEGIKYTKIIDDTYNAAPASVLAALEVLSQVATGRKLAALGGMEELGAKTEASHREVAVAAMTHKVDVVFLVGEKAKIILDELQKRKFGGRMRWFETSDQARLSVQEALIEGDTILVKGSQALRMEKIVKEIMADPMNAQTLLVRQTSKWLKM